MVAKNDWFYMYNLIALPLDAGQKILVIVHDRKTNCKLGFDCQLLYNESS